MDSEGELMGALLVAGESNLNLALRLRGKQNPCGQPIRARQKAMT
jgi:hypothetical protein